METLVKQEVVIKTEVLQEIVGKAFKVCSMMDAFPLTSMLQITVNEGKLTITSTDNINILKLEKNIDSTSSVDFVVNAKLFASLISKISTPLTNLVVEDKKITVVANGKYELPLVTEEDGSKVSLPEISFNSSAISNHVNALELKTILTMNKSCKAEMKEMPSLYNYYMDSERVLTTDYYKACNNPVKMFNNPVCLPPELVDLIALVADDSGVDVQEDSESVLFSSSLGSLYGRKATAEDLEAYPITDILDALNESFNWQCVLNKTMLMDALDRVCLFTEGFDSNAINIKFEKDKLTLTTKRSGTHESIKYIQESNCDTEFNITLDALFLKNQLASSAREDVVIKFGNDSGIELVWDKITQLSSSLDDEV